MRTHVVFVMTALSLLPCTFTDAGAEPKRETVQLPIYFEPNHGQFDAAVAVAARTRGYIALFAAGRVIIAVPDHTGHASLEFVDGARVTPVPAAPLAGRLNYLRGPASRWRT